MTRENTDAAPLHEGEGDELRESVARIIDPAAFMFGPGELDDKVYSASRAHAIDRADRILKLIASARSAPPPSVEVERLREALERIGRIARQAEIYHFTLGASKTFAEIEAEARAALSRKEQEPSVPTPGGA